MSSVSPWRFPPFFHSLPVSQKFVDRRADIRPGHEGLADEHCPDTGGLQAFYVLVGADPAFADHDSIAGNLLT